MTDITSDSSSFDSAKYRQVLGHFPTGVTVITAVVDGTPVGMAVGSFASLSLEPPQVLFCAGHSSTTWPKIKEAGSFCVNILAEDQEDVCRVFASKARGQVRRDRVEALGHRLAAARRRAGLHRLRHRHRRRVG